MMLSVAEIETKKTTTFINALVFRYQNQIFDLFI